MPEPSEVHLARPGNSSIRSVPVTHPASWRLIGDSSLEDFKLSPLSDSTCPFLQFALSTARLGNLEGSLHASYPFHSIDHGKFHCLLDSDGFNLAPFLNVTALSFSVDSAAYISANLPVHDFELPYLKGPRSTWIHCTGQRLPCFCVHYHSAKHVRFLLEHVDIRRLIATSSPAASFS